MSTVKFRVNLVRLAVPAWESGVSEGETSNLT
ncbi:hypothetical protein EV194_1226 [Natronoflexus pectinivorans]|uniref:Uncharacterized protein n=1 Tax=Natronoflexus pectinivorans TaxID=682526 RepID=A0A4R2G5Z4_9BACT|nr:hypothetical protein EV194_1226 [Natronoflexus pectinivorans]